MDLTQLLRKARRDSNTEEIKRIKSLMHIKTRNMETVTVYNKKGSILSVKQLTIDIVPCSEQKDTVETSITI